MNFQDAFEWSLLRSLLRSLAAACLAVPMSDQLSRVIQQTTGRKRYWSLLLVLSPLFAPDLIVGYSYRSFELSLLHRPFLNHCFYFAVVLLKFLPAAAVVRLCAPPSLVSKSALHCAGLAGHGLRTSSFYRRVWLRSGLLKQLPVFGIVFLLTMQEFEIASLMQVPAWTVYLFDAQSGGLGPDVAFQQLILPVVVQAFVLVPVIFCMVLNSRQPVPGWRVDDAPSAYALWPGILIAIAAGALLWGLPLCIVGLSGFSGIVGALQNEILVRSTLLDLVSAIVISVACSVLSLIAVRAIRNLASSAPWRSFRRLHHAVLILLAITPGLFGVLAVSILVVLAIQRPPLTELRSTVWPMAFALITFLMPRAFLLTLLIPAYRNSESSHLATLMMTSPESGRLKKSGNLKWFYMGRPLFLIGAVLFYWSLANLTAAALLCPPTIPLFGFEGNIIPLPVRLYKFIHQGRTAVLSVMALLWVVVPFLLILLTRQIAPWFFRQFVVTGSRER